MPAGRAQGASVVAVRKPLPERERRPKSLGADVAYTAEQIQVLEGREHVRRRPSMYIGSTTKEGLHHLVYEVVDNAVDEALAGYATRIVVTLFGDGSIQVEDDGRGIPVDIHKKEGLSALELVLTRLNAGGKFGGGGYKRASGLHGGGASAGQIPLREPLRRGGRDGEERPHQGG